MTKRLIEDWPGSDDEPPEAHVLRSEKNPDAYLDGWDAARTAAADRIEAIAAKWSAADAPVGLFDALGDLARDVRELEPEGRE
jgi:hypothetical protein